jgi:hypothetical protein
MDFLQILRHQIRVSSDHLKRCVAKTFLQMEQAAVAPQIATQSLNVA